MDHKLPQCWRLDELVGSNVSVILRGNRELAGVLTGYDEIGNIVLRDAIETIPLGGEVPEGHVPRKLNRAIIRSPHICAVNSAPETS